MWTSTLNRIRRCKRVRLLKVGDEMPGRLAKTALGHGRPERPFDQPAGTISVGHDIEPGLLTSGLPA
jgi:hypothetical protein